MHNAEGRRQKTKEYDLKGEYKRQKLEYRRQNKGQKEEKEDKR